MNSRKIYKAKQGGFITDSQYKSNLVKNGVKTWEEKTSEFKPTKTNLNQTGITKINTTKVKIPNEKLEQERLRDLTGQWDLKKVKEDELDNWRNIFAYASILSSDEKAQPDIFNKVRGITYDLILRDIELIRQACRKYGENVKIELKGNSTTNSLTGQNVYYKNDGDGVSSINGLPSDVDPNLGESRGSGADTFLRMNDYI